MSVSVTSLHGDEARQWDDFVSGHEHGHFMQSFAWGEFRKSRGWEPVRLLASRDGTPCAAMQVLKKLGPGGLGILYAPRGPVADPGDEKALAALFDAARQAAPGAVALRLDPYFRQEDHDALESAGATRLPETWSYWNAPKYVFWLDLRPGMEALFKKLASSQRSEIRYPGKKGVVFVKGDASQVDAFHSMMVETAKHKGIACHDKRYYSDLMEILEQYQMCRLVFATFEDKPIATGLSIQYGRTSWLMYAASDKNYFHLRANRALQWNMIQAAADAGCQRYDFRGTATGDPPNPADPGYGVYEYKKSFGPQMVGLTGYSDVILRPWLYRGLRLAESKGLPMAYNAYASLRARLG